MKKGISTLAIGSATLLAVAAGSAMGDDTVRSPGKTLEQLRQDFPGVRVHRDQGRVAMVYGKPMTMGDSPEAAAAEWLDLYAPLFGVDDLRLDLNRVNDLNQGQFTVFAFDQTVDGLPVEYGSVKVLVLNAQGGTPDQVVFASANIAIPSANEVPFSTDAVIDGVDAVLSIAQEAQYADMAFWTDPEQVVYMGESDRLVARPAWKFTGTDDLSHLADRKITFFVDSMTGELINARSEIHYDDVSGTVRGFATPGTLPDIAGNAPVLTLVPGVRVDLAGGNNSFTADDGTFTIPHGGTTPVTLNSSLANGQWFTVTTDQGSVLTTSVGTTPPGPATLTYNPTPSEFLTAQVNGAIHTHLIHNYIADRVNFAAIDFAIPVNTNLTSASGITGCNAFYNGSSINFFRAINGCVNSAYTTVVAHEYGHHIVNRLGLAQGAFGEGYGDTVAMLLYDTNIVGANFRFNNGTQIRSPQAANQQYPCSSGAIHTCGQILGGTWYDMRDGFVNKFGTGAGLDNVRQLQVDWSMITGGGSGLNSAHPGTAIEVLTINDNDGNLDNGTPDYAEICAAFGNRNINCPPIQTFLFDFPNGLPELAAPAGGTTIEFNLIPNGSNPIPGETELQFFVDGPVQTVPATHLGGDAYSVTIPSQDCADVINYRFSGSDGNVTLVNPTQGSYSAITASSLDSIFSDDFETNQGWGVTNSPGLTAGAWERGFPEGNGRGDPADDFDGSGQCYLTDINPFDSNSDIDGGTTTLTSPVMDASGGEAFMSYATWFDNTAGSAPNEDIMTVEISNNNGGSWTQVEQIGPSGPRAGGDWYYTTIRVSDYVTPTSQMRLRFTAGDLGSGSVVEAGVDAVDVFTIDCTTASCPADLTGSSDPNDPSFGVPDGDADGDDFFFYLDAFSASNLGVCDLTGSSDPNAGSYGNPDGDCDGDDFFFYLDLFVGGCP